MLDRVSREEQKQKLGVFYQPRPEVQEKLI